MTVEKTEIIEGGGPGSYYIGRTEIVRMGKTVEEPDWDASDVTLSVAEYTGGSKYTVAEIEVHAVDFGTREPVGIYVELTNSELVDLINQLNRIHASTTLR
jgi:hypothetical protein